MLTKFWAALQAVTTFLGVIRDFFAWKRSADDRAAGRAEANADTQRQNAERVAQANDAAALGNADHIAKPDDDSAFDQEFRRPGLYGPSGGGVKPRDPTGID